MSPTFAGIIPSLSYASQNGVSLVGVLVVVLYAHSTLGKLFRLYTLCPFELSLDNFKQGSVYDFNLFVGLRVGRGRVVVFDP